MKLINTELLANPLNWITVYLMVAFGALAVTLIWSQSSGGIIQQLGDVLSPVPGSFPPGQRSTIPGGFGAGTT